MTARYVAPRSCCFLKASDKTMYKNVNLVDRAFQNHVLVAWEALSCGFFGRVVQHRYGIATGAARREEFWQWQPRSSTFKMSMLHRCGVQSGPILRSFDGHYLISYHSTSPFPPSAEVWRGVVSGTHPPGCHPLAQDIGQGAPLSVTGEW